MAWPPTGPSSTVNVIPAYLYWEYNDDANIQAFFDAYNSYAQSYLNYFNNLNLPVYTGGAVAGPLLDWVAAGLYGILRPRLPTSGTPGRGTFNTYQYNTTKFDSAVPAVNPTYYATSDDTFKRVITWLFYKGDSKVFTIHWLKKRIVRFLNGLNGTDPGIVTTYNVSIKYTAKKAATIKVATSTESTIFAAAVAAGILELPIQTTWTVTLT